MHAAPSATTAAPGAHAPDRAGAFTIIEVLLVLALLAMVTAALAVNLRTLLPAITGESLEERFEKGVRLARDAALHTGVIQSFHFDSETGRFSHRPIGAPPPERPLTRRAGRGDGPQLEVRFLRQVADAQTYLVGGQLRSLEPATTVLFHPDGTCTPFTAELIEGDYRREIRIDPWTAAEAAGTGGAR